MASLPTEPVRETTLRDVCALLALMRDHGIGIWLDGGWAVDAWLGTQTRAHSDVDIVIEMKDLPLATKLLRDLGYAPVPRDDTRAWNFVLGDTHGREVDFHVISLASDGRGIYGPVENDFSFAADSLDGATALCGQQVPCITPKWLVAFHTGYAPDDADRADVLALCERFGIPVPPEYTSEQPETSLS